MPSPKTERDLSLQFPHEIMKGAAGYFSKVFSDHFEAPKHFFFMSYLTCLGNLLANRIKLESSLRTQPRLYTIIIGESASDKKSTAIDETVIHFEEIFGDKFAYTLGVGSAEGLQKKFKKSSSFAFSTDDEDKSPSLSLLLSLDEFKAFVMKCKIRNSILLECVNSLFEKNKYENHTQKTSISLEKAHLSVLGASTVETYERIYDSNFITIGFPNRIFLVVGTGIRKHPIPPPIPHTAKKIMTNFLTNINNFIGDHYTYSIDRDAWNLYSSWYHALDGTSIHSKRLDGYCLRIIMLLAANKRLKTITKEIVSDAIKLCNWEFEVRMVYDPIDADNEIASMEQKIRRWVKELKSCKEYKLKQKTNANRTGLWIFGKAINNLKMAGEIELDKEKLEYRICNRGA